MAKLNVTVPAVDVEVNGVKYRKVDRDAQVGDIIRYDDEDDYVTKGAFYAVTEIDGCGDPQIEDNDGDNHDLCGEEFKVYAKVSEIGTAYREVKRYAKVGERIRIIDRMRASDPYDNGAELTVAEADPKDGRVWAVINGERAVIAHREYVVLEPVTAEEPAPRWLTVGDYAKITGEIRGHGFKIGEIVKIVEDDESEFLPYRGETADDRGVSGDWFGPDEYEPATEAEFLAQTRLKVGDHVKATSGNGFAIIGGIYVIEEDDRSPVPYKLASLSGKYAGWLFASSVVRATDEEVTQAKRKLAAETTTTDPRSQFAVGEKVRLISGGGKHPLNGYDNGGIYEVDTPFCETHGHAPVIQLVGGDIPYGYAKPEQLAKLTIEVGSTVRLTIEEGKTPRYKWGKVSNGDIGTVRDIAAGLAYVDFPAQKRWIALLTELTLVSDGEKEQPQPEPVRFKVGEYARTLVAKACIPTGSIVMVVRDDEDCNPFRSVVVGGSAHHYYTQDELERVDAETAKWAAIGRKVNEFKAGDVVVVDRPYGAPLKRGQLVTVRRDNGGAESVSVTEVGWLVSVSALVTPVEQRFDRMELEATKAAA
ncbi:hypothetical protein ABH892_004448 [Paenibacillus sp. RC254]|uniref:hypothetical protein n=1 Tax=unclassified Paenibacillus TaxID=185978 RepID=UPI0024BA7A34|nr:MULTISPECIES: hypothetical protein [unclassified Paenibacillus]